MIGCLGLAFAFLLIKNPTYDISATVMIKDDSSSGGVDMSSMASSMMRGFAYGDLLGLGGGAVDDEMVIIGSYSNIYHAVEDLQLNIEYAHRPFLRKKHYFDDTPLRLTADRPEMADTLSSAILFKVKVNSEGLVNVRVTTKIKHHKITLAKFEKVQLPLHIETEMGNFTLEATPFLKPNKTTRLKVLYSDYASTTERYQKKFDVDFASKKSDVIWLGFSDVLKTRGKAFLTALIDQYNQYSVREKNVDAARMAKFLDRQVANIQGQLTESDFQIENFKKENKLTDLTIEMKVMLERSADVKEKRLEVEQQLALIRTTEAYLKDSQNPYETIPLSLGATNKDLTTVLTSYNNMVSERQTLLRSTKADNPTVVRLEDKISAMRQSLLLTTTNLRRVAEANLKEIDDEEQMMVSKMSNVPLMEREYLSLKRQAEVTNMLYLYLLNQQAQNEIKMGSDAPKTQIVDQAYAATRASSPKPLLILAGAFLLALILPVIYLRTLRAVKSGVDNAFELSQLVPDTAIYQLHDDLPADFHQPVDDTYINDLRNLRSEIDWTRTKVLAVAGLERETGKSKIAYHLAESIARTQRRVLLIDTDLRHSKLGATPLGHTDRQRTLLTLLEQHRLPADADQLFAPDASLPYLRLLPATDGLQNPTGDTELLQSPQWSDLLAWARDHFDAIVLDTTALDQYPDALPLLTAADRDYFVFTAGRSTKRAVDLLRTLADANQTRDLHLILNVAKKLS
jgi:uncharacterized protein involved in exopolysaccharide biosynthesis/Mrp family chromosome partitioning ATPase